MIAVTAMTRPLRAALSFLTRLPVAPRDLRADELGRALAWFPAAGVVIGLAGAALAAAVAGAAAPPTLVAVGVVALGAALTGGLHLDGVADVADGLAGGRGDRARALEIMRDSRIGAIGATALVLVVLAKVHATAALLARGALAPLIIAPVAARWAVTVAIVRFPYARADGLGAAFHHHGRVRDVALATALTALAVAAPAAIAGWTAAAALATSLAAALTVAAVVGRRLGGLTGDAYGAIIEAAELAALIAMIPRT
jgi:adenosylcobinamide-GDP ribazoletransferase